MSYTLQINLDNASKGLFVNSNPPFFLNVLKEVSIGKDGLASPTTWLVHKVIAGNITVQWNSTYEVFFTTTAIKAGNIVTQSNKTRTPANTGYSYKWDGKNFTVSGQAANKGAIEVINATGDAGVFGISQTVNDGIEAISLGVTSIASNGKIEFTPLQNVTMWMARYANVNQTGALVVVNQLGTHGNCVCLPNAKNEMALNDGRWVAGGKEVANVVKTDIKKEEKKEKALEKKKEEPKDGKKEEPKKEEPKKDDPKKSPPPDPKKPDPKAAPAVDPKKAAEEAKKKAAEDKKKAAEDKKKADAEKKKAAEDKKKEEAKKKEEEKKKAAEAKKKAEEDKKKAAEDKKKADAAKKSPQPARKNTEAEDKNRRDSKPDPSKSISSLDIPVKKESKADIERVSSSLTASSPLSKANSATNLKNKQNTL